MIKLQEQERQQKIDTIKKLHSTLISAFSGYDADKIVWVNKEGKFNTSRLASDTVVATLLGTVGGVVTGVLVKKNQVKKRIRRITLYRWWPTDG